MRHARFTIASVLILAASLAGASDENSLGVYFDNGSFRTTCIEPEASVVFPMYFVLENCSQSSIAGFEFSWRLRPEPSSAPLVLSTTLPPTALNVGDVENLIVGLGQPLVTARPTVLVTLQMMFLSVPPKRPYLIQVGPSVPSSLGDVPAFNDGDDLTQIIAMAYSDAYQENDSGHGGWSEPGIGGFFCAFEDQPATWGSMKARFD